MSVDALTTFLLKILEEEVRGYTNIKSGASLEFQKLQDELRLFEAFIKDNDNDNTNTQRKEEKKEIMRQIRELVYDMQDTIATCFTKKAAANTKTFIPRQIRKLSIHTARQVKSLREQRVKPILEQIAKASSQPKEREEEESSVRLRSVIVFEQSESQWYKQDKAVEMEDQSTLIRYLKEPKEELDIITITGMPGFGKTTLARNVIHHADVVAEFPLRIWIHVSHKFNSRQVLLDILNLLTPDSKSNMSEEEYIVLVRRYLADKKFLLVMDDVWRVEDWKEIEKMLPLDNSEGKVVVTSRDGQVARYASSIGRIPLQMKQLGADKSWELLKLTVFGPLNECPQQLEGIGHEIACQCGGSPLLIRVIGGILKDHLMDIPEIPAVRTQWRKVLADTGSYLSRGKDNSISDAVELSYSQLPQELRLCLLYTVLFPDNHEIPASTLTQLWISEGFIRPKDGDSPEVTAHKFLHDLVSMNLLLVDQMSLDVIKSCRVHPTVREFCKAKAAEVNLFTVVKEPMGVVEPKSVRRLSLHQHYHPPAAPIFEARLLRSLISFSEWDEKEITTIARDNKLLRVLSCNSISFTRFPKVKKLILLKQIVLSIHHDSLPEEISQLLNLETLIIETTCHSLKVKASVWDMMQLRHFISNASIFLLNDKKGKDGARGNLQTMSRLSPDSCTASLSDWACNLRTLGIQGRLDSVLDTLSLEKFSLLRKLKLVNETSTGTRLPPRACFPPRLERLTLSHTCMLWDTHMPMIAAIETLEVLKLKDKAFVGVSWNVMDVAFQNLQFLFVEETDLVSWKASPTEFPSLRCLVLRKCEKLQTIPSELADFESLVKLELRRVGKPAVDIAKRIEIKKGKRVNRLGVPFKLIVEEAQA